MAVLADLASLDHVRERADRMTADHNAIALLINNAGADAGRATYRRRPLSADGHLAVAGYLWARVLFRRDLNR
jgi:short-subunit dehydrogenase involved in D-alanine esterification of teichoic acids